MAVKYASSSSSSLDFILRLKEVRDTVYTQRAKRLQSESNSSQLLTYQTGQDARIKRNQSEKNKSVRSKL